MRKARGNCPQCGRSCALTSFGRIWAHYERVWEKRATNILCQGTGRLPLPGKTPGPRP